MQLKNNYVNKPVFENIRINLHSVLVSDTDFPAKDGKLLSSYLSQFSGSKAEIITFLFPNAFSVYLD